MDKKVVKRLFWIAPLLWILAASIMFAKGKTNLGATFIALGSMFMIIAISQNKKPE